MSTKVVISEPLRTAIGTFGGTLQDVPAVELGVTVVKEILNRTGVEATQIDEFIMGNILGAGQGQNPARQVALGAGLDYDTPSYTLNRVCASGVQSVANAAQAIKAGDADLAIAGGIDVPEIMGSQSTYVKAGIGGFEGRAIANNDLISIR